MPRDDWKRAADRAKYGPVRYSKNKPAWKKASKAQSNHHRFEIPIGTVVSICKDDDEDRSWVAHTTRKRLRFYKEHRTHDCHGSSGAVIFKMMGYLILTRRETCDIRLQSNKHTATHSEHAECRGQAETA